LNTVEKKSRLRQNTKEKRGGSWAIGYKKENSLDRGFHSITASSRRGKASWKEGCRRQVTPQREHLGRTDADLELKKKKRCKKKKRKVIPEKREF